MLRTIRALTLVWLFNLFALSIFCPLTAAAQTPVDTPVPMPTPSSTPTVEEICGEGVLTGKCIVRAWNEWQWGALILIGVVAVGFLIWKALQSASDEGGKQLWSWLADRFQRLPDPTHQYLQWFITQHQDPKFSALSLGQYEQKKTAALKDIYLPIEVEFSLTDDERGKPGKDASRRDKQAIRQMGGPGEGRETIDLLDALKRSPLLTIEGIAGSGKSTLLQWIGLNCAHALLKQPIKDQKELLKALGEPLLPIFISLGAFDRFCQNEKREISAAAMLDFVTDWYKKRCETQKSKSAIPPLPDEFFAGKLKGDCLLLFDGVDEVAPGRRQAVRRAVQEMLTIHARPRTRAIVTARPSASAEAQIENARHGRVLPLDKPKRDQLIRNLYRYYDPAENERRSDDLILRLDTSDEKVQQLAETPLLTTIFTIIHRPGHELPHQRAEVYDKAIDTLLNDWHRKDSHGAGAINDPDAASLRTRMALIAFQLHLVGASEEGKPEDDLIDLLLESFSTTATQPQERREEIRSFLYTVSTRGGLLEEQDCSFGFRTHRTFQEFLAGWHLVTNYAPFDLKKQAGFITQHICDDRWVEPIRLAAGFLAVRGESQAKAFVEMLAGLGQDSRQRDYAIALAGLSLVDLPTQAAYRDLRESLPAKMLGTIERAEPALPLRLRFELGLALGSLKDPADPKRLFDTRLQPGGQPALVTIPAGPFRMGSNAGDEIKLKAAGVEKEYIWNDEKTGKKDLVITLSEYAIGKYPVTNAEYRAFWEADGYGDLEGEKPAWWSETGWLWRTGEWDTQDFSMFTQDYQKQLKEWLARRPKERRNRPFYWFNPQWDAANLPVVGVSWFEAEAYCNWLSHITGQNYRLPTEAEWEKAARGGDGRLWPWGDAFDAGRCNTSDPDTENPLQRTSPVGIYPHGNTALGVCDLIGNVWEWCADWYADDQYAHLLAQAMQDPVGPDTGQTRVLRGGAWHSGRNDARCCSRSGLVPAYFVNGVGFRVVCAPNFT
ncbi:MAG: SUMF1/EgtB/PvdO family nonheme iron enzyme [Chloroflexota bacterium]